MIVDYYFHRDQHLEIDDLYDMRGGIYRYQNGWNRAAVTAFAIAATFSIITVWVPWFAFLTGYNWIIGALLGGAIYNALAPSQVTG